VDAALDEVLAQACQHFGVNLAGRCDGRYEIGKNPVKGRFSHRA
jgi:hypothetical protein